MMGNICDKLNRVEKHGSEVSTSTYDARKLWVEPKSNNNNRIERPRRVDYEALEEDIVDIGGVGDFKDETIGHKEGFW